MPECEFLNCVCPAPRIYTGSFDDKTERHFVHSPKFNNGMICFVERTKPIRDMLSAQRALKNSDPIMLRSNGGNTFFVGKTLFETESTLEIYSATKNWSRKSPALPPKNAMKTL